MRGASFIENGYPLVSAGVKVNSLEVEIFSQVLSAVFHHWKYELSFQKESGGDFGHASPMDSLGDVAEKCSLKMGGGHSTLGTAPFSSLQGGETSELKRLTKYFPFVS